MWLQFENKAELERVEDELNKIFEGNKGNARVMLYCREERQVKRVNTVRGISYAEAVIDELKSKLGCDNVKIVVKIQ